MVSYSVATDTGILDFSIHQEMGSRSHRPLKSKGHEHQANVYQESPNQLLLLMMSMQYK